MDSILKFVLEKLGPRIAFFAMILVALWFAYLALQSSYRESRKEFLVLQLETVKEIVDITAKISTTNEAKVRDELVARFWEFYHGRLTLVEDKNMAVAMVDFAKALSDKEAREPIDHYAIGAIYNRRINQAALGIAWAGRDLIARSWTQNLLPWLQPEVEGPRR